MKRINCLRLILTIIINYIAPHIFKIREIDFCTTGNKVIYLEERSLISCYVNVLQQRQLGLNNILLSKFGVNKTIAELRE